MPFADARRLDRDLISTDLCIVGAGAAGITIARELAGAPFRVLLCESGDLTFRHGPQLLYRGRNVGLPSFSVAKSRFRRFGGSTTHWAGQCRPLDPIDFEKRDWVPHSGWPISREELDPYYARAHDVCSLGPYDYDPGSWSSVNEGPLSGLSEELRTLIYQFSGRLDFGVAYHDELARASNLDVLLNANLVEIETEEPVRSVKALCFATLNGRCFRVKARAYVLACGGIENARLLLCSNRVAANGLGNDHDLVGRFFMDHPYFFLGAFEPSDARHDHSLHVIEKYGAQPANAAFGLSERRQRSERLNGASVYFIRRRRSKTLGPYFSDGGKALARLIEVIRHEELPDGRAWMDLKAAVRGYKDVLRTVGGQAAEIFRKRPVLALRATFEPTPDRDSRVLLDDNVDRLGLPRSKVDWRLREDDRRSLDRLIEIMEAEFARTGLGKLIVSPKTGESFWPNSMSGGKHHIGTTRMHSEISQGIVDADCRVHGMANLYVAGSSVFPTAGYANPTLTIVALAIRIADHLKSTIAHLEPAV